MVGAEANPDIESEEKRDQTTEKPQLHKRDRADRFASVLFYRSHLRRQILCQPGRGGSELLDGDQRHRHGDR